MTSSAKQLRFPSDGVGRELAYHDQPLGEDFRNPTFTAPFACNVRGRCSISDRGRGGSRPGFVRVQSISSVDGGRWAWANGEPITWPDGRAVGFSSLFDEFSGPDGTRLVNPHERLRIRSSSGDAPVDASVMCIHRGRMWAASGTSWYCSATGDFGDWDYGVDGENAGRACSGNVALATRKGERITAMMSVTDAMLFICTNRAIYMLAGEPTSGRMKCISDTVGCVGRDAWAYTGPAIFFISTQGLFSMSLGEHPRLFSTRIPEEFKGLDETDRPLMVYDPDDDAIHVFTDAGCWYVDLGEKAFWPFSLPSGMHPIAGYHAILEGVNRCAFMCEDGAWRAFSDESEVDDGDHIVSSKVAIGPFRMSARDDKDSFLSELHVTTGEGSSDVYVHVTTGHSAEEAARLAEAGEYAFSFAYSGGWNPTVRPRVRGAWCVLTVEAEGRWAYESILATIKQLGRLRP